MSAVFITATGTGIGKTFVTAGLIRQLRASGHEVDALKPVMTGFDPAHSEASDAGMLLAALDRPVTLPEIERIAPWRFAAPLSPDMAALREHRAIDFGKLLAFSRNAIANTKGTLLIEGIGGVMVPLDNDHTVLDWMAMLDVPILIVTGSYLGSLSHTLTGLDALRRRNLDIKALVINETPDSTVPLTDTVSTLKRFAAPIPVVPLPWLRPAETAHPAFGEIANLL
jgi:dethiobiotin synthetase